MTEPSRRLTFEEVRDWAIEQATTWTLDEAGQDRLAIDGIEVRWALRVEVFNRLLPLGLGAMGLSTETATGPLGWLRRSGRDRSIRAIALAAMTALRRPGPVGRADVLFVSEFATPSTLEPMLAVAERLDHDVARPVAADPRAYRAWRAAGANPLPLTLPPAPTLAVLRQAGRSVDARWRAIETAPPAMTIAGRDVSAAALAELGPLVRRSVPWLVAEREAVARVLDAVQPSWVVLASDQHRIGRLAVAVARDRGARSLVLQHGLPQYAIGYVPVAADLVATWSETADAWFVAHGTTPARLARLGNPRLDRLAIGQRDEDSAAVGERPELSGRPRLLVTLSPNDRDRNAAIVRLALGAATRLPAAAVLVKLHPGDGEWDAVRQAVEAAAAAVRGRVAIARREPLYPMLRWADLVLLHRSTVAVEALAAGTPVAVAAIGPASADDAAADDLRLPEVARPTALAALLTSLAEPGAREAFLADRAVEIRRSTGPLDGRSAERIAGLLRDSS